jgi:hypothetical protein
MHTMTIAPENTALPRPSLLFLHFSLRVHFLLLPLVRALLAWKGQRTP